MPPHIGVASDVPAPSSAPPSPDSSSAFHSDSASVSPHSCDSASSLSPEASEVFRLLTTNNAVGELLENENEENLSERLPGYQRIVFPREQNLLDLLRSASGSQCVSQLREVRLRVVASDISLSRLGSCAPRLRTLTLDGSGLCSLREIGTDLRHLTVLRVAKCGLLSLDGTFGLTTLRELHAADNQITNVGPCAALESIRILNLDRNPINSLHNVGLLSFCPHLAKLSLMGTPVQRQPRYRETLLEVLPNLRKLDDAAFDGNEDFENILESEPNDDSANCKSTKDESHSESESASWSFEVSSMTEPSSPSPGEWRRMGDNTDSVVVFDYCSSNDNETNVMHSEKRFDKEDNSICYETVCSEHIGSTSQSQSQHAGIVPGRPSTALGLQSYAQSAKPIAANRPSTGIPIRSATVAISEASMCWSTGASRLTSGAIVCGSIGRALASARVHERVRTIRTPRPRRPDAWLIGPPSSDAAQLDMSTKDDCEATVNDNCLELFAKGHEELNRFHHPCLENAKRILWQPLPEKPSESTPFVELEFGVTGLIESLQQDTLSNREDISEDALKASRLWRKAFKLYRKHNK